MTGHHVYKESWTPEVGENIGCSREPTNQYDRHAVAACLYGEVVGHISRAISKPCSYALLAGAKIDAVVTGSRKNTRHNGLEVPVEYHVKGPREHMVRAHEFIRALI